MRTRTLLLALTQHHRPSMAVLISAQSLLSSIDVYYGTGLGSSIALLLACGYQPLEIYEMSEQTIRDSLSSLISARLGYVPTLMELYLNTGKCFVSSYCNIEQGLTVICDYQSHSNMSCLDAVRLSNLECTPRKWFRYTSIVAGSLYHDPLPYWFFEDQPLTIVESLGTKMGRNMIDQARCNALARGWVIVASTTDYEAFNQGLDLLNEELRPTQAPRKLTYPSQVVKPEDGAIKLTADHDLSRDV